MWQLVEADALAPRGEGVDYISRLVATVLDGDTMRVANMMSNILRFFAWQHLLLLPLLLWGIAVARKDRLAGALAGGIALTAVVMFIILPYQGHGFGYRYLHGLIGNFILLAVYGWARLGDALPCGRSLLLRTTVAALFVTFPLQAWMAHAFYAPAARASERIVKSGADYVVIGADDAPFTIDLVINSPDLVGRPIRLVRSSIDFELVQALCAPRPAPLVIFAGKGLLQPIGATFGLDAAESDAQEANRGIASHMREFGCRTAIIE
jgi:hypothetical protein